MKKDRFIFCTMSLIIGLFASESVLADPFLPTNPKIKAADKIPIRAYAFDLRDVRLLDGPFLRAKNSTSNIFSNSILIDCCTISACTPACLPPPPPWEDGKSRIANCGGISSGTT